MQGEQGAAGAHAAVGVGSWKGATHFIGQQVRVSRQTLGQFVVHQLVKGECASESGVFFALPPPGDHGRQVSGHQDALREVSLWQTGGKDVFLKDDAIAELKHS